MNHDLYQKYLDNIAEGQDLVKKNLFNNAGDQEALLRQIRENSCRTYELRLENETLIEELVLSRKAEELTPEDVQRLIQFADDLLWHLQQNDAGIAYRVHQLLYDYAVLKNDTELLIRQLYHLGTNLHYLNPLIQELGINPFNKEIVQYLGRAADYLPRCSEFTNPDTIGYIIRSRSNIWLADERTSCPHRPGALFDTVSTYPAFMEHFHAMMELYHNPEYRALLPDFPWDRMIYTLHYNRCQYCLRVDENHPREILEGIYESAQYVYEHAAAITGQNTSVQNGDAVYFYTSMRYKLGLISLHEMLETLFALAESADPNDFSINGIVLNFQIPLYLGYAYYGMNAEDSAAYRMKLFAFSKKANDYLLRAPHNEFSNVITRAVGQSICYRINHHKTLEFQMFSALLFCHPPTFIHVHMSASLCRTLMLHMAETVPEKLIGLYGITDPEEIRAKAAELGERIYLCALFHDVGKLMLLDYISIYGRRLLDEEFAAIKLHPQIAASLMERLEPPELAVVSLHHHRFYNEQGGYPENCPPCPREFKALVDIVSVCDSIEAATDDIGRSYSVAKPVSGIIEELRRQSGTRYSPDVVALFDEEDFCKTVEELLLTERRDLYFKVYGGDKLGTKA